MTKTEKGLAALNEAYPIRNRGHAFMVLKSAGICSIGGGAPSRRLFTSCVKAYQEQHGVILGKSKAALAREAEQVGR